MNKLRDIINNLNSLLYIHLSNYTKHQSYKDSLEKTISILERVGEIKEKKITGVRYDKGSNSRKFQDGYNQAITDIYNYLLGE